MNNKRILFITQDLAVGGGTSSLSALFDTIKSKYDITVLCLTKVGNANVSYKDKVLYPKFPVNYYYQDFSRAKGIIKIFIGVIKAYAFLYNKISRITYEEALVNKHVEFLREFDYVISYGEGVATTFTQYIKCCPKAAWIHFEISRLPFSIKVQELYSSFDKIVVVSENIRNCFETIYPQLANRIVAIHNLVDWERIKSLANKTIPEAFDCNCFNIISLGRITPVKRFSNVPFIASLLKANGIVFKWRILGPDCDDNEKKDLMNNIIKYNVDECVEYLGNRTNPYPYLAKSDLLVILSISEACPMVILESRTLNIPVLSTDFTTSFEFINNNKDGLIRTLEQIPGAIKELYTNSMLYKALIRQTFSSQEYTKEAVEKFNLLFE